MSPGRCAVPDGMFSTRPTTPTALTLALRAASSRIRPMTTAEPAMSHFMSPMPAAGLIEMPPVSKVTPLPTKASGLAALPAPASAPCHSMTTTRGGRALPWPTPSSAFMPSSRILCSSRISTSTPSSASRSACCGQRLGVDHVGRLRDQIAGEENRLRRLLERLIGALRRLRGRRSRRSGDRATASARASASSCTCRTDRI